MGSAKWVERLDAAIKQYAEAPSDYVREQAVNEAKALGMSESDLQRYGAKHPKPRSS